MVEAQESVAERRVLRSDYSKILTLITENRDDIGAGVDSNKFDSIIKEVENLHHHVRKPREQVADAEALLNLTSTLTAAVEFYTRGSVTQSEFVSCLLRKFGQSGKRGTSYCSHNFLFWRHLGLYVSPIFKNVRGCRTMLGPMKTEVKQRKVAVRRRYAKPVENVQPEQLNGTFAEEKTETDKNMVTMFEILTKKKAVKIEHLLLNRMSFAQTVENLFALSFLVKDGRVEIVVDEMGSHIVSPRNHPTASSVRSGEVKYTAFIFRFDFKDWKLMKEQVPEGQELMPNRVDRLISGCKAETVTICSNAQSDMIYRKAETESICSQAALQAIPVPIPVKASSRNHGMVLQNHSYLSSEIGINSVMVKRCKCKLEFTQ